MRGALHVQAYNVCRAQRGGVPAHCSTAAAQVINYWERRGALGGLGSFYCHDRRQGCGARRHCGGAKRSRRARLHCRTELVTTTGPGTSLRTADGRVMYLLLSQTSYVPLPCSTDRS